MALNSRIIKRITKTTTSDVAHSSGYAQAQSGGNMGATSVQSFSDRLDLEKNRTTVQGYKQSQVARAVNFMPKALSEEEKRKILAAEKAKEEALRRGHQEYNSKLESGGLRRFDVSNKEGVASLEEKISRQSRGFGRQSAEELRLSRQQAAEDRKVQADRFAGGVRKYEGGPKTFSGGTGIQRRSGH